MSRPLSPCRLWAILIRNKRTHWIYHMTIKRTRKEAKEAWLSAYSDRALALKHWRRDMRSGMIQFVAVEVTVVGAIKP